MNLNPAALRRARTIADAIADKGVPAPQQFWAIVAAVDSVNHLLTLTFPGSSTPIPRIHYLAAYTPTVGDRVTGLSVGTDFLVHGKTA